MSAVRYELIHDAYNKAVALLDYDIHDNIHKQHEFKKKTILADKSLTKDEKNESIRMLNETYDRDKLTRNEGTKRICEHCQLECLATLFCEHCVRNYLKSEFSNWTSGNDDIDNLIQTCQREIVRLGSIIEWIPYDHLQNIKYLTKGGCSEIYTAVWNDGLYNKWDNKEQKLKRLGAHKVILKKLENVESANQSWFEEVCNLK